MRPISVPIACRFFKRWRGFAGGLAGVLALSLFAAPAETVDPRTLVSPELPEWITPILAMRASAGVSTANNTPLRMLVLEQQFHVASGSRFQHSALRIESEAGLQHAGQIGIDFAPGYQRLRWHLLRIWRDGVARDVLEVDRLQVINQEQDAEKFVYHGRLTAHLILRDLRVGDVIESAYTITGDNPVFGGRFSTVLGGAFSAPVDELFFRIITPRDRALHVRPVGKFALSYATKSDGADVEHLWRSVGLKEVRAVSDAPNYSIQFPFVQVSEFESWAALAGWGSQLFQAPETPSPAVRERVAALTGGLLTLEAKADAIVRFVQDEVRYLGINLNESSHRPAPPDEVLNRRYGDCKDKSLLLVTLLRAIGVKAHVALVNSAYAKGVETFGPSPLSFDHAIVRLTLPPSIPSFLQVGNMPPDIRPMAEDGLAISSLPTPRPPFSLADSVFGVEVSNEFWVDPTMSLQGGDMSHRFVPDYGYGLILGDDATKLERVRFLPEASGGVEVGEFYSVRDYESPVVLQVVTTYRGGVADVYRYWRRFADPQQSTQQLTGLLARYYPKISATGATTWTDDRKANVLIACTRFSVPEFWTIDAAGKMRSAEVYPWALSERLPRPETTERIFPFALPFPQSVKHEIDLELPKDWPVHADMLAVDDATFRFNYRANSEGAHASIFYHWRTLADAVPAERVSDWGKRMAEVRSTFGYRVQQNIRLAAEMKRSGIVWSVVALSVLGLAAGLVLGIALYRWRPVAMDQPPPLGHAGLTGIDGWLILLAIGIVIRPLVLLTAIRDVCGIAGNLPGWIALTDAESVGRAPGYQALAWTSAFLGWFFLSWTLVSIPQFFRRKASLPRSLIAMFACSVLWHLSQNLWTNLVLPSEAVTGSGDWARIIGGVFSAGLWTAYLLTSKRVACTFRH